MDNEKIDLIIFLSEKKALTLRMDSMIYGSVEIRENGGRKYIYVHKRIDGIKRSAYVGEYNESLYLQIVKNNTVVKELKKRLRVIDKKLEQLQYSDIPLSDKVRLNVDFAKRNMVDTIYKQAVLEGIAVTFLDTETIIDGGKINNISVTDVQKINNLKHAWQLILDAGVLSSPTNYNLLCLINRLVEEGFYFNAGAIRTVPVAIGGTKWKPDLPIESMVREKLEKIIANTDCDVYAKAIKTLLYIMRKQIFIDGNKRTAVIFANHILISAGAGLVAIPDDMVSEYKKLLIDYYETNVDTEIFAFIENNCLTKLNKNRYSAIRI